MASAHQPPESTEVKREGQSCCHQQPKHDASRQDEQQPKRKQRDGLYIHPREAGEKPTKVSCAACISGHRSGHCCHFDRILLKIRAAGRPTQTCHHPSSCGGSCLKPRAYVVPGETPEWCGSHRSCIMNWEISDTNPPYPIPAKRKQRSPSPVESDDKVAASPVPCRSHLQEATRVTSGGCCRSEQKEPWHGSSQQTPMTHNPLVLSESSSSHPFGGIDVGPIVAFDYFPPPQANITPISAELLEHGRTSRPAYDLPATASEPNPSYISLSSDPASEAILWDLDSLTQRNPMPTRVERLISRRPDGRALPKRPCPGNGYQCPCEGDQCNCAKCYTHDRGLGTASRGADLASHQTPDFSQRDAAIGTQNVLIPNDFAFDIFDAVQAQPFQDHSQHTDAPHTSTLWDNIADYDFQDAFSGDDLYPFAYSYTPF